MKKFVSLIVLTIMMGGNLFSQDCLNDVYYTLVNQNNPGKAKNQFDKKCMKGNEGSAAVWLMKGNVYMMYYFNEMEIEKRDTSYRMSNPLVIIEAYEAFSKALELNPEIKPMSKLFTPIEGQIKCANPIEMLGHRYRKEKDYDKAIEYFIIAQNCYKIGHFEKEKEKPLDKREKLNDNIYILYTNINIYETYRLKKDSLNYRTYLIAAYQYNKLDFDFVYEDRFALFLNDADTSRLINLINRAYRNIPDTLGKRFPIQMLELKYRYITNQTDTLKVLALNLINTIGIEQKQIWNLTDIMQYLVNINAEDEIQNTVDQYLAKYENDIIMIKFKSRIYLKKLLDINDEKDRVVLSRTMSNSDKLKRQAEIVVEKEVILEQVLLWLNKANQIAPDDHEVIRNLYRVKRQNGIPIEPELEQKFQDIMSNTPK